MDLTTLVILLVSLTAALLAGIIVLFRRQKDPDNRNSHKNQKDKPLIRNSESMSGFMGRHLSAIPIAIVLILILVLLEKCGVV